MAKSDSRDTVAEQDQAQAEAQTENQSAEQDQTSAVSETTVQPAEDAQVRQYADEAKAKVVLNPDFAAVDGSVRVAVPGYDAIELTEKPVEVPEAHASLLLESPAAKRADS